MQHLNIHSREPKIQMGPRERQPGHPEPKQGKTNKTKTGEQQSLPALIRVGAQRITALSRSNAWFASELQQGVLWGAFQLGSGLSLDCCHMVGVRSVFESKERVSE